MGATGRSAHNRKNRLGMVYGLLTVIGEAPNATKKISAWRCRCVCGKEIVVRSPILNHQESCGCKAHEAARVAHTKHGHAICGTRRHSSTYKSWMSMVQRCYYQKHKSYSIYGGAGITICDRWRDFSNFLADMGERPTGMSIDRFPNQGGNYEPGNCRWATYREQAQNRHNNVILEFDGKRLALAEWARVTSIPRDTLQLRIKRGWPVDIALTKPIKRQKNNRPNIL